MIRKILPGLALFAALASPVAAQTVDELIAKNIEAKGGMTKLKAVNTMKASGKLLMGHQGVEAEFVMLAKRPKQTRVEFVFGGMKGIQAFDGTNAWMVMPFMGKKDPEAMPADETKMLEEQADIDGPLVDWKDKGHKVELVGKEQVEGADAYKLKVTLKGGDVRHIYLDAESFLEIKAEGKRKVRGTEVEGESTFGDYKEVNGMMVAHTMESGAKGSEMKQKMVFSNFEFNSELPDSLFAMPPGTKPASPPAAAKEGGAKGDSAQAAAEAGAKTDAKATTTKKAAAKSTKTKKP